MLELKKNYGYIAGVELQSDYYRLVVINLNAETVHAETGDLVTYGENITANVLQIISVFQQAHPHYNLIGVGIGITGIINSDDGCVNYSIPLRISEPYRLSDQLEVQLGIPVLLENDANCGAWSELNGYRAADKENFIFILMKFWEEHQQEHFARIGVGLGIVIDGKVYKGSNHSAGEFKSIFSKGRNKSQFALSDEEINRVPEDTGCTQKYISELSSNMALLVNTFNIHKVIVGCDVSIQDDYILDILMVEIKQNWQYPFDNEYEVSFSSQSENIVAHGAASMFLEKIFEVSFDNELQGIKYL